MAKKRKNSAAVALAKRRLTKMSSEDRARVARLGGLAKALKKTATQPNGNAVL